MTLSEIKSDYENLCNLKKKSWQRICFTWKSDLNGVPKYWIMPTRQLITISEGSSQRET